jgi:protocatechuate 3,4-dioxygenase beta subunit
MPVLVFLVAILCHAQVALTQSTDAAGEPLVLLHGRVIAAGDAAMPLRGARVSVVSNGQEVDTVVGDAEGQFEIRVPAPGGWSLRVTKAGYAPVEREVSPVAGGIDVALTPGAAVTGRVVDSRGDPIADAPVRVRCLDACMVRSVGPSASPADVIVATDDRGVYRVGSLPAGRYAVDLLSSPFAEQGGAATAVPAAGTSLLPPAGEPGASEHGGTHAATLRLGPGQEAVLHLVRTGGVDRTEPPAATQVRMPLPLVRGRIIAADGRPVPGASVQLQSIHETGARVGTSDTDGRYEIAGIPPGDYRLSVRRGTASAPIQYGQERALQQGTPIAIRSGQVIDGLDVRLPPTSAIEGRVVDAYGEPLEMMQVQVWEQRVSGGRRVLASVFGTSERQTDDRGAYRLYGLLPGTYYVVAHGGASVAARVRMTTSLAMGDSITAAAALLATHPAVQVFHPGSMMVAEAVPVRLHAGIDAQDVDITFAPPAGARIHGMVIDAAGRPVRGSVSLRMSHRSGLPVPPARTLMLDDGTFSFDDVAPGEYLVQAVTSSGAAPDVTGGRMPVGPPEPAHVREFGAQFVTVTGAGDFTVSVQTAPGARVSGRVVVEGPHPDVDPRSFAVGVVPADPDLFSGAPNAQSVVREGMPAFEFTGFFGPVRFDLRRALPGWYLRSAVIDGVDAADYPVTLGPSTGQGHMVDVVVAEGGAIVGSVTDADGAPARDYHVVVFPTDASRWYYRSRWMKLSRADAGGGFDVSGLPPGEYWAAAVDWIAGDETDGAWQTPDVLGSLVPGAQRVRVRGIERVPVTLRLMRMP